MAEGHLIFSHLADIACAFLRKRYRLTTWQSDKFLPHGHIINQLFLIKKDLQNTKFRLYLCGETKCANAMKGRNRVFKVGELHHIYQRTVDGYLIFYSGRDFLVFFTLFCTLARKYDIQVLGLCLMYDHIHVLVAAPCKSAFSAFVREYTSRFSRLRNIQYQRKGQFFQHRFGSAPKLGEKKVRTAISYLYNNPVEKKLCVGAEEFQWCFLAYAHDANPFSEPLKLRESSRPMRRAISEVEALRAADIPLSYEFIQRATRKLGAKEIRQLTDFIISQYNCIDYNRLTSFYDSFNKMLLAIHSNTGSEYQVKEIIFPGSDTIYHRLSSTLRTIRGCSDITSVLALPEQDKRQLAWLLAAETGASPYEIAKFLQFPLN